jgi:hypothetical protein
MVEEAFPLSLDNMTGKPLKGCLFRSIIRPSNDTTEVSLNFLNIRFDTYIYEGL